MHYETENVTAHVIYVFNERITKSSVAPTN
uniref:Uncharacterized protein n=1 Tax=Arundo donax TaxID=35708 RepID=A0A0A9ACU2_ARUDO